MVPEFLGLLWFSRILWLIYSCSFHQFHDFQYLVELGNILTLSTCNLTLTCTISQGLVSEFIGISACLTEGHSCEVDIEEPDNEDNDNQCKSYPVYNLSL